MPHRGPSGRGGRTGPSGGMTNPAQQPSPGSNRGTSGGHGRTRPQGGGNVLDRFPGHDAGGAHSSQQSPMQRDGHGGRQQVPLSHDSPDDPRNPNYQQYQQQQYQQPYGGGGQYPDAGQGYNPMEFWGDHGSDSIDPGLEDAGAEHDDAIADDHDHVESEVIEEQADDLAGFVPLSLANQMYQVEAQAALSYRDVGDAYVLGRFGFMLDPSLSQGINQQVLAAQVSPDEAREWTLNLVAAKWNAPASALNNNGEPPDNQVVDFATSNGTTLGGGNLVRIEYGVDGGYETVDMDYPMRGGSINFVASNVRVSLVGGQQFPPCMVGGFLVPKGKHPGSSNDVPTRTVTVSLPQASAGPTPNPVNVCIPARAKSYRLFVQATAAQQIGLRQFTANVATQLSLDCLDTSNPFNATFPSGSTGAAMGFKLHPSASIIQLRNNSLTTSFNVAVQFDLDLG